MSASNRAGLINKLQAALKKHYKPLPTGAARPLLEHVLYASLLQDAPAELADEGMAKCEQEFFDWNEVRVTSVTELTQVVARLPEPAKAASRLKGNLQAIFEEFYTFDLDHLKKENLGRAVAKFEKMPAMTPFVLSYTIQHGLGGHSIPIDYSAMVIMLVTEIASQPEANSGKVPGLERAVPKSKGVEFSGLLHQCAVALNKNPKDKTALALIDSVNKGSSKRLEEWLKSKKAAKKRVVKRKTQEKIDAEEAAKHQEVAQQAAASKKSGKKAGVRTQPTPSSTAEEAAKNKAKSIENAATTRSRTAKSSATGSPPQKSVKKKSDKKPDAGGKNLTGSADSKKAPAKKTTSKKTSGQKTASASGTTKKATSKKASVTKKSATKKSTASKKSASGKKADNRKLTKRKPR